MYANTLGYNYLSSKWYKESYRVFNKDYKIDKKTSKKEKKKLRDRIKKLDWRKKDTILEWAARYDIENDEQLYQSLQKMRKMGGPALKTFHEHARERVSTYNQIIETELFVAAAAAAAVALTPQPRWRARDARILALAGWPGHPRMRAREAAKNWGFTRTRDPTLSFFLLFFPVFFAS